MVALTERETQRATAWPRPIDEAAYLRVREAYLDRLFATGEVRAAYQMGGVAAPGLSDLDLILVCRDPVQKDINAAADIRSLGEEGRYVLMHSQFLLNEDIFRRQKALFWASNLRHLRGERIQLDRFDPDVERCLQLAFNVEMMLRRFADFERIRGSHEPVAVRPLLAELNGIRFNLEMARDWIEVSDLEDYPAALRHLRACWFDLERRQAHAWLKSLLDRAVEVIRALLERLRPIVGSLHSGALAVRDGRVRTLEIHEYERYGPWPLSVEVRANPLGRAVPRPLRGRRPVRPHLAPVLEVRVPAEFFVFPALQAEALRAFDAPALSRRVIGEVSGIAAPGLTEAMGLRADALVGLWQFAARNRLRRLSYLLPATWHRPYPWQFRIKARLLEAAGVG